MTTGFGPSKLTARTIPRSPSEITGISGSGSARTNALSRPSSVTKRHQGARAPVTASGSVGNLNAHHAGPACRRCESGYRQAILRSLVRPMIAPWLAMAPVELTDQFPTRRWRQQDPAHRPKTIRCCRAATNRARAGSVDATHRYRRQAVLTTRWRGASDSAIL